ncbi:hypothetical protein ACIQ9P_04255 [Kitasatospora sp. NPDC094019]|uniref:hypothetical protein n=1 Tax=Kitasatospora sp. NPDC094019 TaxID=3364091 RepID=UPI0037FEBEBF
MDIDVVLLITALGVAFTTAVVVTPAAWRSMRSDDNIHTLNRWARTAAASLSAIAIALSITSLGPWVETTTGVGGLAMLLSHLCGIGCCVSLRVPLVAWTYPRAGWAAALRLRFAAGAAVAVAASAVFFAANQSGVEFVNANAGDPGVAAYLLIVDAYWAVVGARIARDCVPLAVENFRAGHRAIAAGQSFMALGGIASMLWGGTEGLFVAVTQITGEAWDLALQDTASSACAGLFSIGLFGGTAISSKLAGSSRRRNREKVSG